MRKSKFRMSVRRAVACRSARPVSRRSIIETCSRNGEPSSAIDAFSIDAMVNAYVNVYRSMLSAPRQQHVGPQLRRLSPRARGACRYGASRRDRQLHPLCGSDGRGVEFRCQPTSSNSRYRGASPGQPELLTSTTTAAMEVMSIDRPGNWAVPGRVPELAATLECCSSAKSGFVSISFGMGIAFCSAIPYAIIIYANVVERPARASTGQKDLLHQGDAAPSPNRTHPCRGPPPMSRCNWR